MKKVFLSLFCAGILLTGSMQAQTGDCATHSRQVNGSTD
jgi:hypothetical protein